MTTKTTSEPHAKILLLMIEKRIQNCLNQLLLLSEVPSWLSTSPRSVEAQAAAGWRSTREERIRRLAFMLDVPRVLATGSWGIVSAAVQARLRRPLPDDLAPLAAWCEETEAAIEAHRMTPEPTERPVYACRACDRRFEPGRKDQVYCENLECRRARAAQRARDHRATVTGLRLPSA